MRHFVNRRRRFYIGVAAVSNFETNGNLFIFVIWYYLVMTHVFSTSWPSYQ